MSNQEILEKAIQKAIDGGWKKPYGWDDLEWNGSSWHTFEWGIDLNTVIFSQAFSKALWGQVSTVNNDVPHVGTPLPLWQYHLQQMVIADDPIKYLGENI